MNSFTNRVRARHGLGVKVFTVLTAGVATSLLLAACGSSSSSSESSAAAPAASAAAPAASAPAASAAAPAASEAVNPEAGGDLQATVDLALNTAGVDAASLDPAIQSALTRAAGTLTAEQVQTAMDCWSSLDCTIPGGGDQVVGYISPELNTWRKTTRMEAILQALTYPEVGRIISITPEYDLAQMQAGVRQLSADGATVIVGYNDFGPALAPAFKSAQDAGALVSIFVGPSPGTPVDAITTQVTTDLCAMGTNMAKQAQTILGTAGSVAFFNGTPGNPQGAAWNKCVEDELAANAPDIKVTFKADTNWSLEGAFKAATALLASGKPADIIMYDYADPMTQIVKAFDQAGKPVPAFITWTSNNDLFKEWEAKQSTDNPFKLFDTNSLTWVSRVSVSAMLDQIASGTQAPALVLYPLPVIEAKAGDYKADKPADYPGQTLVPAEVMDQMLAAK